MCIHRLVFIMQEQKSICKLCVYPSLEKHVFSCNYQHFVGVHESACVILPLKIINTGVVPGRPAAYSAWLSTMPQKWSHSPIHPSLHPSIHLSVPLSFKKGHHGLIRRQESDQIKLKWRLTHATLKIFCLCCYSSTCQFLCRTLPVSLFLHH